MGGLLDGLPVAQVSAGALFLAICWWITRLVLTGRLVPRQQLLDTQADRDFWRTACDVQQQIALKHGITLERLLALAETTDHALTEIQVGLQHRPEDR